VIGCPPNCPHIPFDSVDQCVSVLFNVCVAQGGLVDCVCVWLVSSPNTLHTLAHCTALCPAFLPHCLTSPRLWLLLHACFHLFTLAHCLFCHYAAACTPLPACLRIYSSCLTSLHSFLRCLCLALCTPSYPLLSLHISHHHCLPLLCLTLTLLPLLPLFLHCCTSSCCTPHTSGQCVCVYVWTPEAYSLLLGHSCYICGMTIVVPLPRFTFSHHTHHTRLLPHYCLTSFRSLPPALHIH